MKLENYFITRNDRFQIINKQNPDNYFFGASADQPDKITTVDFDTFTGAYYVMAQSVYRQGIGNLSAGTYNWNLQYKAVGGGNAFCANFEMGYMVLGK